jgi:hypothetical protein
MPALAGLQINIHDSVADFAGFGIARGVNSELGNRE